MSVMASALKAMRASRRCFCRTTTRTLKQLPAQKLSPACRLDRLQCALAFYGLINLAKLLITTTPRQVAVGKWFVNAAFRENY
jgi:hypothetical protein